MPRFLSLVSVSLSLFSSLLCPLLSLCLCLSLSSSFPAKNKRLRQGIASSRKRYRALLDKAYAGADYPTYRAELLKLEAIVTQEQKNTPVPLQPKTAEMLGYLRTAGEILRWQTEQNTSASSSTNDRFVQGWIEQYPFLSAAVGAHTPDIFDGQTAVTLLWDKTNAVLPEFQVKSRPL